MSDCKKKYLILKESSGTGLGDKIISLVVAILYSKPTDRILYVDWRDHSYGTANVNYFPFLFELPGVEYINEMPKVKSVWPPAWHGRLSRSMTEIAAEDNYTWHAGDMIFKSRYSADILRVDYDEEAVVFVGRKQLVNIPAYITKTARQWRQGNIDPIIADVLKRNIKPEAGIFEKIKKFQFEHFSGKFIIGIHVRCTEESNSARTIPPVSHYINVVKKTLRLYPEAALFLSTDNIAVETKFKQIFGEGKILKTEKWLPKAGESIHKNKLNPDGLVSIQESLIDIYLLSKCDYLIYTSNSSFSKIAKCLFSGNQKNKAVIASVYDGLVSKLFTDNRLFFVSDRSLIFCNPFSKMYYMLQYIFKKFVKWIHHTFIC